MKQVFVTLYLELLGSRVVKYEQKISQLESNLNETHKELSNFQNEIASQSQVSQQDKSKVDDLLQTIKDLESDKTILQKTIVDLDKKYSSIVSRKLVLK